MDRSDVYGIAWILILYLWLILSRIFLTGIYENVAGIAGLFIIVVGMFIQDYIFMYRTMPYPYLRAVVRPSGQILHLFIKERKETIPTPDTRSQNIKLTWPVKMDFYGKVSEIVINHRGRWQDRVQFRPGKARYRGWTVNHSNTEQVILYEQSRGSFDVDHAEPIPVFVLAEASGDYYLNMPRTVLTPIPRTPGGGRDG